MEPRSVLVAAHDVAHAFTPDERVLHDVQLELAEGELLVVIGPNGAGKSTLLRILAGSLTPDVGRVALLGRPLSSWNSRERARELALVPQWLPALPQVLVEDFVASARYAHLPRFTTMTLRDRAAVRAALAACDVQDLACRAVDELSGGQRQRVLIARALAQEARVLLVDEPTNALDPAHQVQVLELLARACGTGRAALVVTHDLVLASQYATRLVLLHGGRIVANGSPETVLVREVLEPVYGPDLYYARWPTRDGVARGFALPLRPAPARTET